MAYRKVGRVDIGQNLEYDKAIEMLMKMKIKPEKLAEIFGDMKHINVDTFIIKMASFLHYMTIQRNMGLSPEDKGYISKNKVVKMIRKDNRIMQRNMREDGYIQRMATFLDTLPGMNKEKTNLAITNLELHKQSYERLVIQCAIMKQFGIEETNENLLEYALTKDCGIIVSSPQLMFARLCYFKDSEHTNNLGKKQINYALKRSKQEFATRYHISDEELAEQYPLPDVTGRTEEEIQQLIQQAIEGKIKEEVSYKESLKVSLPQKRRIENRSSSRCEIEKEV